MCRIDSVHLRAPRRHDWSTYLWSGKNQRPRNDSSTKVQQRSNTRFPDFGTGGKNELFHKGSLSSSEEVYQTLLEAP